MISVIDMTKMKGSTLSILGKEYTFDIEEDIDTGVLNLFAVWKSEEHTIYATPDYEEVPLSVYVFDEDVNLIGKCDYIEDINSWDWYCRIVTKFAERIIIRYEEE